MLKKDAIEILKGIQDNLEETRFLERCAIDMAIEALKERPYGEWVESKERKGHFYCSECVQEDSETGKWRETFDFKYPFCPNCGADMRKEGERNDR